MKTQRGVTLIELVVVMVIIGILASIAIPTYRDSVRKSKRRAAQSVMMDIVNREHQYLASNREFGDETALGITLPSEIQDFYDFAITVDGGPPPNFRIDFTAKGMQTADGDLSIDSFGTKGPPEKW